MALAQVPTFSDTEACLADVLRAELSCAVYGELPADPVFPCVRLVRVGGSPVATLPTYLDAALVQCDVFADSKGQGRSVADAARGVLAALSNTSTAHGLIAAVRLGSFTYTPETAFTPPKARYRFDLTCWTRVATPATP